MPAFILAVVIFVGAGVWGLIRLMKNQGGYVKLFIISGACLIVVSASSYIEFQSKKDPVDPVTIVDFNKQVDE